MPIITSLLSFFGSALTGLFNFKGEQAKTVQQSLMTLNQLSDTEAQSVVAQSQAISAILTQGSFLERNWRSVAMCLIMLLVTCYFFGYYPPNIEKPLPPMIDRLFNLFEIGLGGYIVRYGIRDMIREFKIADIIKTLIQKKLL